MKKLKVYPKEFPETWASDWSEDEYGLRMGFNYRGVKYAFRWIEPGEFLMGSPKDEPERGRDETQHKVEITQGFWIGETSVTQELWSIVMGENFSRFKGEYHPVDSVSWEDVQCFIDKMNSINAELKLCLPTEAQWEYACRAGTITPLYFGEQIDSSLANFDGNYPYNKGRKSAYREKTLEVKTLNPNNWGLYEMHGNIYEWCNDRYGLYPTEWGIDPIEVETYTYRVLRGGSWIRGGRHCRSAYRGFNSPDYRYYSIGFRLTRGHVQQG